MEIKKKLFAEKVAPNLKPGAILSTNTSGLSVNEMAEALPEALRPRFLVTHFFNPPRYMQLLEIVAEPHTDPGVAEGMAGFIRRRLGKGIVFGKDTPNFVANRIGVYAICNAVQHMLELGMTVEEVDAVAGPATARPKSAFFRTADLVGLDTLHARGQELLRAAAEGRAARRLQAARLHDADGAEGAARQQEQAGLLQEDQG